MAPTASGMNKIDSKMFGKRTAYLVKKTPKHKYSQWFTEICWAEGNEEKTCI